MEAEVTIYFGIKSLNLVTPCPKLSGISAKTCSTGLIENRGKDAVFVHELGDLENIVL